MIKDSRLVLSERILEGLEYADFNIIEELKPYIGKNIKISEEDFKLITKHPWGGEYWDTYIERYWLRSYEEHPSKTSPVEEGNTFKFLGIYWSIDEKRL